jgi:hypothetical protein
MRWIFPHDAGETDEATANNNDALAAAPPAERS